MPYTKELENEFMRFWIDEGILYSEFKFEVNVDLNKVKQLISTRHTISGNVNQYWCYDISKGVGFPKESRDYVEIYGQDFLDASAVVINSHIHKFLFNTFIKLKKPRIPFMFFTKKEDAVKWLIAIKAKNTPN